MTPRLPELEAGKRLGIWRLGIDDGHGGIESDLWPRLDPAHGQIAGHQDVVTAADRPGGSSSTRYVTSASRETDSGTGTAGISHSSGTRRSGQPRATIA